MNLVQEIFLKKQGKDTNASHVKWMELAINEAKKAFKKNEVPVGAVVVKGDELLSKAHNTKETSQNPVHHAEILAIQIACDKIENFRLTDTTMYVTLEPCIMCAGAIINSRISHLVFGARDPKAGGVVSLYNILSDERLNHKTTITEGILKEDSTLLLNKFFQKLRSK